jgi:translation initiation factor 1
MKAKKRLVYSTDTGRHCPHCSQPLDKCLCKNAQQLHPGDGIVRLQRESKGRNGKPVTLIKGLGLDRPDLKSLCKALKSKFGVGGSCLVDDILIQGDMRKRLAEELGSRGFTVKISGG